MQYINEWLWIFGLVVDLGAVFLALRLFGRDALVSVITFNLILCNIQVMKTIQIFGAPITLGNIAYGSVFLATDILGELYGKSVARRALWLAVFNFAVFTAMMQLSLLFVSYPVGSDWALHQTFSITPRLFFASVLAMVVAQNVDISIFHWLHKKTRGQHLWLRNNVSTMVSQVFDTVIFSVIVFLPIMNAYDVTALTLTSLTVKWVVALLDTPFIYLAKMMLEKNNEPLIRSPDSVHQN